jgi:hypothetical protein
MLIEIEYMGVKFDGYKYDTEKKVIIGKQNTVLKTLNHKTYKQITLTHRGIPYQVNYDKVIDEMEENYQKSLKIIKKMKVF